MEPIDRYRRSLKRKNYAGHTIKAYLNVIAQFTRWLESPLEQVTRNEIGTYTDHLLHKRLSPKTVTCHLQILRGFYDYLISDEGAAMANPIRKISIRLPKPLPRHLTDEQVANLFSIITKPRDRAMFMLMLRSGLRVEEVARLTVHAIEYPRRELFVRSGKGAKDRVVYLSDDAHAALSAYLQQRTSPAKELFLVEKGPQKGKPIAVRSIQKRIEYYAQKSGLEVSCHSLRHTMATQLLNADAQLSSIQDLLGHTHVTTTERYCRVANLKVQRDYFKAMDVVMQRMQALEEDEDPRSRLREHRTYGQRRAYGPRREKGTAPVLLLEKQWMKSENGEKGRFHEK